MIVNIHVPLFCKYIMRINILGAAAGARGFYPRTEEGGMGLPHLRRLPHAMHVYA